MWALDLEDMSAAVVKRIPLHMNRDDSDFHDDEVNSCRSMRIWITHSDNFLSFVKFHHWREPGFLKRASSNVNFKDDSRYTSEKMWHIMPHHVEQNLGRHTITREEPCDYKENHLDRYDPVKTADGRYHGVYEGYRALAQQEPGINFIGRCGTYQYLHMDQVINQPLTNVQSWLQTSIAPARGRAAV